MQQHHAGGCYLWGNAVPPLMAQGIHQRESKMALLRLSAVCLWRRSVNTGSWCQALGRPRSSSKRRQMLRLQDLLPSLLSFPLLSLTMQGRICEVPCP